MLDFGAMPEPKGKETSPLVSDEEVEKVAKGLIEWGYRLSNPSGKALTEVMSNHSVMLFGKCGTGKSLFFKALSEYTTGVYDNRTGRLIHPYKFAVIRLGKASYRPVKEIEAFLDYHQKWSLVVDDLGSEYATMEYGSRFDALGIILESRDYTDACTHFISNLDEDELKERYGGRIVDRLHFAEPIVFPGNSCRMPQKKIMSISEDWYRVFGVWQTAQPPKNED